MNNKRRLTAAASVLAALGSLGGCSAPSAGVDGNLLGLPRSDTDRLTITITCNSSLDYFAAAVEERFPGVRLVQDRYTGQYRISIPPAWSTAISAISSW